MLVAPYRHPLVVAAMAGTLGRLAGDRLILGVGIGYLRGEFEVLGADYDARAADTEAWIDRVRNPPDGFSVVDAPTPVPIWIGGNNESVRRAALFGDGWHPLWLPAELPLTQQILAIRARRESRHRSRSRSAPASPSSPEPGPGMAASSNRARPPAPSSATRPRRGPRPTADRVWSAPHG